MSKSPSEYLRSRSGFFLTFSIHIIDFLLLGFYPSKMTSCTSLHQNLLCNTLTVTRNVNFTLSSYIKINSIPYTRNYYNSDGCEFFSPVTVTREVNFPLFIHTEILFVRKPCVTAKCFGHYVIVSMYCSNCHGRLCGKKTPGFNRLYLPQYAECTKLASPYFVSLLLFCV